MIYFHTFRSKSLLNVMNFLFCFNPSHKSWEKWDKTFNTFLHNGPQLQQLTQVYIHDMYNRNVLYVSMCNSTLLKVIRICEESNFDPTFTLFLAIFVEEYQIAA